MGGKRRGRGEDSVYFDQANGYWVGSVSLGFAADGKRRRRTVRGRTKTEVRDKLRGLREEIAVGVRSPASYSVRQAVDGWLRDGLDGRSAATVTKYRHVLKPVLEHVGHAALRDLTAHDVRHALTVLGKDRSSATVAIAHNALTRAIRHAEGRDLVRRNVAALVDSPTGQEGRPSQALTLDQAQKLLETAGDLKKYRLGAYVSLCLLTGMRTEEARALTWEHVDLEGQPDATPPVPPSVAVWRSVRQHDDTKTRKSRRTLALPQASVDALSAHRKVQATDQLAAGGAWQDHGLVFSSRIGTPLDAANIRRQFREITDAAGLGRGWAPQELRHILSALCSCRDSRHRRASGPAACAVRLPPPRCRLLRNHVKRVSLPAAQANCDTGTTEHGECGQKAHVRVPAVGQRDAGRGDRPAGRALQHPHHRGDLPP